jgi:hypothetical protein
MRRLFPSSRLFASLAAVGSAAALAGLGTYATFTGSTSASQSISTGTLTLALGTPGPANRLTVNASGLAAGDTVERAFELSSAGTIGFGGTPALTTSASSSSLLDTDTTNGLQMVLDKCSVAWTESGTAPAYTYTCSGTQTSVLASTPVIGSDLALSNLSELGTAGGLAYLRLKLTLPSGAGNTLQNQSSTLTYAFSAPQRAATSQ